MNFFFSLFNEDIVRCRMLASEAAGIREEKVYEYQRWNALHNPPWGSTRPPNGHFLATDNPFTYKFSTVDAKRFGEAITDVSESIDTDRVISGWCVIATTEDPDGWQYSTEFSSAYWYSSAGNCKLRYCILSHKYF